MIHIVEPTLSNEAGHCLSFVTSLANASPNSQIYLWANRAATLTFSAKNITLKKYFFRKVRKIQCYFLYKKLLKSDEKIFISTASRLDLSTFNLAAKSVFVDGIIPENKVYFYFHWMNDGQKKLAKLKQIALQQPNFQILGTTPTLISSFTQAGFKHAEVAAYPISTPASTARTQNFAKVLFAGAARQDKGFAHVVNLVEYAAKNQLKIPFLIQSSAEHFSKMDAVTKADVTRLNQIAYPNLEICSETLTTERYFAHFAGAICIQVYHSADFADRVSGVTLDALSAGSPILTLADTWIARQVQRFNAGIVLASTEPQTLIDGINEIIANYATYSHNAQNAGKALQQEHNAQQLSNLIFSNK